MGKKPLIANDVGQKLNRLVCPRFWLSCRYADWMSANDYEAVKVVSPDCTVTSIHLESLSKRNFKDILVDNYGVEDADRFVRAVRERAVNGLLTSTL